MLAKAHNGGEDGNAAERTYIIKNVNTTDMILTLDYGAGGNRWNIHLKRQ